MSSGFDLQKVVSDPWSPTSQADFFLKLCENLIREKNDLKAIEEKLTHYATQAAKLAPSNPAVFFRIASYYYTFFTRVNDKKILYLALDKILEAFAVDSSYFEREGQANFLWAQILVSLSIHLDDETFLMEGIKKYEKALMQFEGDRVLQGRVLWEMAKAYFRLAKNSFELQEALASLERYSKAATMLSHEPSFWLDYGIALVSLGKLFGKFTFLKQGCEIFQKALQMKMQKPLQKTLWLHLLETTKQIALLTGKKEDFEACDELFQTTILAYPEEAFLWLKWGDFFLKEGWRLNNIQYIEKGIEKVTSLKSSDCDPTLKRILLAEGLLSLGYIIDDFYFIQEGLERLKSSHGNETQAESYLYAKGFSELILGLYFSDERYFEGALFYFEKGLEITPHALHFLSGIADTYITWGNLKKQEELFNRGFDTFEKLHSFYPASAYLLDEWGVALLKLYHHHSSSDLLFSALDKFKKALELHDEPEISFHFGIAFDLLGLATQEESYFNKAIFYLKSVLKVAPEFLKVSYHLGLAYLHYGEAANHIPSLTNALNCFEMILKRLPEDEASHAHMGKAFLCLFSLHEEKKAKEESAYFAEFHLIEAMNLGSKEAAFDLGCLYSLTNRLEKSLLFLEKSGFEMEKFLKEKRLEKVILTTAFQEILKKGKAHE